MTREERMQIYDNLPEDVRLLVQEHGFAFIYHLYSCGVQNPDDLAREANERRAARQRQAA